MLPEEKIDELKRDIEVLGHKVTNIWNIKRRGTKVPLNMSYIELKVEKNKKDIYETTHVLGYSVKFELLDPKREIPQCISCQRYGKSKGFCNLEARCVKCARDHPTFNCRRKTKSENVKCMLCEGNRPANYKGCTVYKDLQKRYFPTLRRKEITTKPQLQVECTHTVGNCLTRTYASITITENSSSTVSQIYRATQERAVLLSLDKFIEEVMQEVQKELKEFLDKTSQLIFGLMTVVTESMQWKKN